MKHVKQFGLMLVLFTLVITPWSQTAAQQATKPALVVTLSSIDELVSDAKHVVAAVGLPGVDDQINSMLEPFTAGIDQSRAIGAIVSMEGELGFTVKAFVPVKDFDDVLPLLEAQLGPAKDAGNGIKEFNGPVNFYVKAQGGWAHVSQTAEGLAKLPANPLKLLGGLDESYDFAVRANVQSIPPLFRNMAISQLKAGVEAGLEERQPDESEELYELRRKMAQNQVTQMEKLINETEDITIGWNYDQKGAGTYFDFGMTAKEGTALAKSFGVLAGLKSNFAGFLAKDAAVRMNMTSKSLPEDIENFKVMLQGMRESALNELDGDNLAPPNVQQALKEVLSDVMDVLEETVEEGVIDGGLAVFLRDQSIQIGGGFHVVGGKKLESAFKKMLKVAQDQPDFPEEVEIRFNTETYQGISFHTMSVPVPDDEEEAQKIFGDELQVALGTSDSSVYFGIASNSVTFLKSIIDKNKSVGSRVVTPFEISVALLPILDFASSFEENPIVNAMVRELKTVTGKDHIAISATMDKETRGVLYRFQLEEGVIKAVGAGVQAAIGDGLGF